MNPIQNADGHVGFSAREHPIATNTSIKAGQVVKISAGLVVSAAAGETAAILGIAAEAHSGSADALNPRSNGPVISVYDNPGLIFECPAPVFAASGGSATTVTAAAANVACTTADAFNGGILKLKSKAAGNTNTDKVGDKKAIVDFASANSVATFTVASGQTAVSGDEFILFPPIGATGIFNLNSAFSGVVLSGASCSKIKVVGYDLERDVIKLMAVEHTLGVEN